MIEKALNDMFNILPVAEQTLTLDASDELLTFVHDKFPGRPWLQYVCVLLAFQVLNTHMQELAKLIDSEGVRH